MSYSFSSTSTYFCRTDGFVVVFCICAGYSCDIYLPTIDQLVCPWAIFALREFYLLSPYINPSASIMIGVL